MAASNPIALRLNEEQRRMLRELASLFNAPEAVILRMALKQLYDKEIGTTKVGPARGAMTAASLAKAYGASPAEIIVSSPPKKR